MQEYQGIILKKISYKESSEIIYLYTKEGLISVLIHGSKKIKSPFLNLTKVLNYVKVITTGKDLKTLKDGEIIINYSSIHESLEKYTYLLMVSELVYYFSTHEHDHEKLLSFLVKVIEKVKITDEYIPFINMLELKLLYLLGVNPIFNKCLTCGSEVNLVFSVQDGGVFCNSHIPSNYYDNNVLNTIKMLYYFDININNKIEVETEMLKKIRRLIDEYYEYHLNYFSKTRKMLKGLIGY